MNKRTNKPTKKGKQSSVMLEIFSMRSYHPGACSYYHGLYVFKHYLIVMLMLQHVCTYLPYWLWLDHQDRQFR